MTDLPKYLIICIVAAAMVATFFPDWWQGMMNSNCARMGGQPVKTEQGVTCAMGDK